MRVLAVDPGLTRCGVAVLDGAPGRRVSLVDVRVVRTPAEAPLEQRLCALEIAIESVLDEFAPQCVAVERVFSQHNLRTVMGTAQASAVAVLAAGRRGLPLGLHTPTEVKAAVTGSGTAGKEQVATMVRRLLGLDSNPKPADASDAIALAICHLWRAPAQNRLAAAVASLHSTRGIA